MLRNPVHGFSLVGAGKVRGPRPSFQPAMEALEERVVLSPSSVLTRMTTLTHQMAIVQSQLLSHEITPAAAQREMQALERQIQKLPHAPGHPTPSRRKALLPPLHHFQAYATKVQATAQNLLTPPPVSATSSPAIGATVPSATAPMSLPSATTVKVAGITMESGRNPDGSTWSKVTHADGSWTRIDQGPGSVLTSYGSGQWTKIENGQNPDGSTWTHITHSDGSWNRLEMHPQANGVRAELSEYQDSHGAWTGVWIYTDQNGHTWTQPATSAQDPTPLIGPGPAPPPYGPGDSPPTDGTWDTPTDPTPSYIDQIYQDQAGLGGSLDPAQQTQDHIAQIFQHQQELDDYLNSLWQNG